MHRTFFRLTCSLALLAGCGDKPDGDSASGSSSSGADETIGHSSMPTGEVPDATGDASTGSSGQATTMDATGPDDGTSTQVETGDVESTGVVEPTVCGQLCQHAAECRLDEEPAACEAACERDLAASEPACAAATEAMLMCFAGLDCAQLEAALAGEFGHPCGALLVDQKAACGDAPAGCDFGAGGPDDGSACEVFIQCPGDPKLEMVCDTEACLCFEADEKIGSCQADGVCLEFEALGEKATSCCGFPDTSP